MIHEALLHLWHCSNEAALEFLSNEELNTFLHPGEYKLMKKILTVATKYNEIEEFRKSILRRRITAEEGAVPKIKYGLYLKAFCNGLDDATQEYRDEIVHLEETILNNSQLPLMFVFSSVDKYITLFDILLSIILAIEKEQLHGCVLIEKLDVYCNCGMEIIVRAVNKLVVSVNCMFYRQLCNWIVYGDLLDRYDEFFIADAKCADEMFSYSDQVADVSKRSSDVNLQKRQRIKRPCEVRKFYIKPELLPSILTKDVAESILFMGRVVWIVRNGPKEEYKHQRDVWEGKAMEYYKKLQDLEDEPFHMPRFNQALEECRLKLSKYFWTVMMEEANLMHHLQLIREYCLLGRGELFQHFIKVAESQLKDLPSNSLVTKLNLIFIDTAQDLYSSNDKSYLAFELNLSRTQETDCRNFWNVLEMNFDMKWPLHIFFHPRTMYLYNKIFRFLLRLKKTHIKLQELWFRHSKSKKHVNKSIWMFRNNLMFLVNNLLYYLQVDVIEAQFAILKEGIKNANEFENIIKLHAVFLSNLLTKGFLMITQEKQQSSNNHCLYEVPKLDYEGTNKVYKNIMLVLQCCDDFCAHASIWSDEFSEAEQNKLDKLQNTSNIIIKMFFRSLYTLYEATPGPYLLQLIHRLDFNKWFSKTLPDLNINVN